MALGRTKIGRRQSQDDSFADSQAQPDQELESYLSALSPADQAETTNGGRSFGSSEVFQVRLPLMANERLKELAARQGTSPAALAKDWIMQHLADGQDGQPAPEAAMPPAAANQRPNDQFGADPYAAPQQLGQQQFGQQQPGGPMYPGDQQYPGDQMYPADQYGADQMYGDQMYGDPMYGGYPGEQQFAGGPQPGPGPDQFAPAQFPAEQYPAAPANNPYAGPVPPGTMPGPAEQPPGLGTQVLNGQPPEPNGPLPNGQQPPNQQPQNQQAPNQQPGAQQPGQMGTQMLGAPSSPDASTQMIGADQYGQLPAEPADQFPSSDFPGNQLPGQGPAWPQQETSQPPRARNPYVSGGPPPAAPQPNGSNPFETDVEKTVPGTTNGYY